MANSFPISRALNKAKDWPLITGLWRLSVCWWEHNARCESDHRTTIDELAPPSEGPGAGRVGSSPLTSSSVNTSVTYGQTVWREGPVWLSSSLCFRPIRMWIHGRSSWGWRARHRRSAMAIRSRHSLPRTRSSCYRSTTSTRLTQGSACQTVPLGHCWISWRQGHRLHARLVRKPCSGSIPITLTRCLSEVWTWSGVVRLVWLR